MKGKRRECIEFGRIIRKMRTEKGFSQEEFAFRAQMHRTYAGMLERGEKNPTLTTILQVAIALEVRPSGILNAGTWDQIEERPKRKRGEF